MHGGRGGRGAKSKTLLNAAALQDHLARTLKLPNETKIRTRPAGAPAARPGASDSRPSQAGGSSDVQPRRLELTLAQRRNLVERPPEPLTEAQWQAARAAAAARNDPTGECAICRDAFKVEEQVLLSCSHVFHAQCIKSFEKFAKRKCCPLCRLKEYERRRIEDGAKAFRRKCAVRIQAAVRGYLTRKWYRKMLASMPPKDPVQRRKWFADKLSTLNRSVLGEIAGTRREIEELFAEISERQGRDYLPQYPESEPESDDSPMPSPRGLGGGGDGDGGDGGSSSVPVDPSDINWDAVIERALERSDGECPICMAPLQRGDGKAGCCAWLSCSHVFHAECLGTFELYAEARASGRGEEAEQNRGRCCPMCRASYVKKCL